VGSPTDTLRKDSILPPVRSKKPIVFRAIGLCKVLKKQASLKGKKLKGSYYISFKRKCWISTVTGKKDHQNQQAAKGRLVKRKR